jgi:hypothetical protein
LACITIYPDMPGHRWLLIRRKNSTGELAWQQPDTGRLIALTCNEIHHLFNVLIAQPVSDLWHRVRWSTWRRHQHRARTSHYQRRTAAEP